MADARRDDVLQAAAAGDVTALASVVAAEGPASVRLDDDPDQFTALHLAAGAGHTEAVRYLLSPAVSADVGAARINNFTPLHSAAMKGHAAVCEALLAAGASVNVQTVPQGYAPLHSAAFAGHLDAIRVLLAHGADPTLVNYRNERPADTAERQGQTAAVQLLRRPPQNQTLQRTAAAGMLSFVRKLLGRRPGR
jgi:ankyrin repeat protein